MNQISAGDDWQDVVAQITAAIDEPPPQGQISVLPTSTTTIQNMHDPTWTCICGTVNHYFNDEYCRDCGFRGPMAIMGY